MIGFGRGPPRPGDIYRSEVSNELISRRLGWRSRVDLREGIKGVLRANGTQLM